MCGERPKCAILVSEGAELFLEFEGEVVRLTGPVDEIITNEEKKTMRLVGRLTPDSWGDLVNEEDPPYFIEEDGELVHNT